MAKFKIEISSSAEKALKKFPKIDLIKVVKVIQKLGIDPKPPGSRKLSGETNGFRVRQGNDRIIYEVEGNKLFILVLKIGHRKDIYKK